MYKKIFLIGIIFLLFLSMREEPFQWDFIRNRSAAHAFSLGFNPYQIDEVRMVVSSSPAIMFPYLPHTLFYFDIFNFYHLKGEVFYFLLKMFFLCLLFILWKKTIISFQWGIVEWIIIIFAFRSPINIDLNAGNISIFEQVGLFGAIYFLIKKRPWASMLLIVSIAQFKLIPIVFLGILLIGEKAELKAFCGGIFLFLSILCLNYFLMQETFLQFLASLGTHEEYGFIAPCSLTVIRDLIRQFGYTISSSNQIYLTFAFIILSLSTFTFFLKKTKLNLEERITLFLFTYFICVPWFKDYSYILLIPVFIYFYNQVKNNFYQKITMIVLIIFSAIPSFNSYFPFHLSFIFEYKAYFIGMFYYFLLIQRLLKK